MKIFVVDLDHSFVHISHSLNTIVPLMLFQRLSYFNLLWTCNMNGLFERKLNHLSKFTEKFCIHCIFLCFDSLSLSGLAAAPLNAKAHLSRAYLTFQPVHVYLVSLMCRPAYNAL